MRERPILFSGPMVRAILDGRKTQTRRIVRELPGNRGEPASSRGIDFWRRGEEDSKRWCGCDGLGSLGYLYCPYGEPGDRLWVRETWAAYTEPTHEYGECDEVDGPPSEMRTEAIHVRAEDVVYGADGTSHPNRWRPSIHMPRWASRITLEVTDVRVERLQSISDEDAHAEGVTLGDLQPATINGVPGRVAIFDARKAFAVLWDQINGERAPWSSNPWIWVVGFKRVDP